MKILGIFAHPDDEIIFGWPIFQNYGISKHAAYMTGEPSRLLALSRVGEIANFTWECAGFEDFTLSNHPNEVNSYINELIKRTNPDFIYCHNPDGEYGHPDHKAIFLQTLNSEISKNILISNIIVPVNSSKWETLNEISKNSAPYYGEIICNVSQQKKVFEDFENVYKQHGCWTWSDKYSLPSDASLYILKADKNLHRKEIITLLASILLESLLKGAEIGVFKGTTTEYLSKHLSIKYLLAVDPWAHSLEYEDCKPLMKEFKKFNNLGERTEASSWDDLYRYVLSKFADSNVKIIRGTSAEAINEVNEELDFVFIDGDHSYEAVLKDISLWCGKLKPNGLILGHDYTWNGDHKTKRPVCRAVNDFFSTHSNQFKPPIDPNRNRLINRSYDRIWWQQKI